MRMLALSRGCTASCTRGANCDVQGCDNYWARAMARRSRQAITVHSERRRALRAVRTPWRYPLQQEAMEFASLPRAEWNFDKIRLRNCDHAGSGRIKRRCMCGSPMISITCDGGPCMRAWRWCRDTSTFYPPHSLLQPIRLLLLPGPLRLCIRVNM